MNKSNILKILVPIVAIVIVVESLVLINNLNKKKQEVVVKETPKSGLVNNKSVNEKAVVSVLVNGVGAMKLNETSTIEVKASALQTKSVDSINVYLKYNPAAFELSNLTFDKRLPTPTFSKISINKGLVVVNFLVSDPSGLKMMASEDITLMKFDAKPKSVGKFEFEINTGNELKESATMFVENATSAILPFSSNKLTVDVGR